MVPSLSDNKMLDMVNSNIFSIEDKIFYFGTLIPSNNPEGITEKFKIFNRNKITCQVNFKLEKRTNKNVDDELKFEVFPETVRIGPHEHRYVNVKFSPDIMT